MTDNLVEMMAGKIGKLSLGTQYVLKICACIGNRFDLEILACVRGTSVDTALGDLTEAINEGLVSRIGDMYVFHHDRIQEAAYSLVGDSEKSALHYKIGKLTLDTATENERQNKLFYIVDQLNLGSKMITGGRERENLARVLEKANWKIKGVSQKYKSTYLVRPATSLSGGNSSRNLSTGCASDQRSFVQIRHELRDLSW